MRVIKKIFLLLLFSIFYSQLYSQDNIHDFLERLSKGNYVIDFYCDVLKSGNRDTMHTFSNIYVDKEYPDPDYGVVKYKWFERESYVESINIRIDDYYDEIDEEYFEISDHGIYLEDYNVNKNVIITFRDDENNGLFDDYSTLNWKKVRQKTLNTFYFRFDGDYLYIYLNGETDKDLFATFVNMNDETFSQFKSLIANNKCDLSKVTWPRHADGSCDYDGSKSTSTTITPNKLMSVTENLKLRSAEATTSKVLAVMAAGTKVKVLELGKAETIDGINS
ncbi:MAG: hypothetical protein IKQ43_05375, partial [Treponema sp.]|nr:hypothetical protein [Treponema sp.]